MTVKPTAPADANQGAVLRAPAPVEIDKLARLDRALFGDFAYPATTWRQLLDVAGPLLLIAAEGGEPVAYGAILQAVPAGTGWLVVLGVRADRRGRGLGRALTRRLLEGAQRHGIHTVRATVAPDNAPALRVYESLGFTRERTVRAYYGPGKDRIVVCRSTSG